MIALYIILGIILLIVLVLNLPVGARMVFNNDESKIKVFVGFVGFPVLPKKVNKQNYKSLYKKIKNVKLSEYEPKAQAKPKKKKSSTLDDFKQMLKDKDNLKFIFNKICELLQTYSAKFKKHFHITIDEFLLSLELDSPDKTCIALAAIYPAIAGLIAFLEKSSKLQITDISKLSVAPSFTEGVTKYSIDVKFRVRICVVLIPALKTVLSTFIKINQKQERKQQNG